MDQFNNEYLNDVFKNPDFVDYETVKKSRELFTAKALIAAEKYGVNEIDLLTRVLTRVTIKEGEKPDVKYSVELSLHKPASVDNLKMYDASLVTYYFNALEGKKPVIRYITGNSADGQFLVSKSENEINAIYDTLMKRGLEIEAKKVRFTWEVAKQYRKFKKITKNNKSEFTE